MPIRRSNLSLVPFKRLMISCRCPPASGICACAGLTSDGEPSHWPTRIKACRTTTTVNSFALFMTNSFKYLLVFPGNDSHASRLRVTAGEQAGHGGCGAVVGDLDGDVCVEGDGGGSTVQDAAGHVQFGTGVGATAGDLATDVSEA